MFLGLLFLKFSKLNDVKTYVNLLYYILVAIKLINFCPISNSFSK